MNRKLKEHLRSPQVKMKQVNGKRTQITNHHHINNIRLKEVASEAEEEQEAEADIRISNNECSEEYK